MPYGNSSGFSHKKRRRSSEQSDLEAAVPEQPQQAPELARQPRLTKDERYCLFARLAWHTCYSAVLAAERAADASLMNELAMRFASTRMRAGRTTPVAPRTSRGCSRTNISTSLSTSCTMLARKPTSPGSASIFVAFHVR